MFTFLRNGRSPPTPVAPMGQGVRGPDRKTAVSTSASAYASTASGNAHTTQASQHCSFGLPHLAGGPPGDRVPRVQPHDHRFEPPDPVVPPPQVGQLVNQHGVLLRFVKASP